MKLFIAGGCREHGRNSFLLDDRDECLLIDCGKGEGDFCFPQLNKEQIRKIRCLFLTHSHKDHSGGIEWLIENGFHGSIISTEETRTQCKIDYESWNILPVAEQMPLFRQLDPSLHDAPHDQWKSHMKEYISSISATYFSRFRSTIRNQEP